MATCRHVKDDGAQCQSSIGLSEDLLCIAHDPLRQDVAAAARSKGQQAKRDSLAEERRKAVTQAVSPGEEPAPLRTPDDAVIWASWLATAAATGVISPQVAREVGSAIREFRSSFDTAKMAAQLAENAKLIKKLQQDRAK